MKKPLFVWTKLLCGFCSLSTDWLSGHKISASTVGRGQGGKAFDTAGSHVDSSRASSVGNAFCMSNEKAEPKQSSCALVDINVAPTVPWISCLGCFAVGSIATCCFEYSDEHVFQDALEI